MFPTTLYSLCKKFSQTGGRSWELCRALRHVLTVLVFRADSNVGLHLALKTLLFSASVAEEKAISDLS